MQRRPSPPTLLSAAAVGLAVLAAAVPLGGATLLTSGSEVHVRRTADFLDPINGAQGFSILVPPGATSLVVEFRTEPNIPLELMAREGLDVGLHPQDPSRETLSPDRADHFANPNNLGVATITVVPDRFPKLRSGTYYIGFMSRSEDLTEFTGILRATVSGGPIESLHSVVESTFDSGDEGWMRNDAVSPYPGTNVGARNSRLFHFDERGNPGGFIAIRDIGFGPDEFFVAPDKFHVDLLALDDARIAFDLARINGGRDAHFSAEVRVYTDDGAWKFTGRPPASVPSEMDFFAQTFPPDWVEISAPIRSDLWNRFAGSASFAETMANPKRIEIRANYTLPPGVNGIDNVRIEARGDAPAQPVLPTISTFESGFDDWTRNDPLAHPPAGAAVGAAGSRLLWSDDGGNPAGRITLADPSTGGVAAPDAFVPPHEFLGIYSDLVNARFEFDYEHISFSGADRPVTIRMFAADGSIYEWTGAEPHALFSRQTAPLTALAWERIAGDATWADLLAHVVRIEVSANQASESRERNSLDNFALLTSATPPLPQSLTVSPTTLSFAAPATAAPPEPRTVRVTASGPPMRWEAETSGAIADRITLSKTSGDPPESVEVAVDTQGLAAGSYTAEIAFTAMGATLEPRVVAVDVTISEQPYATPEISAVTHAASFEPRLAAGALGSIFGENFAAPATGLQASFVGRRSDELPTSLGPIRVLVCTASGEPIIDAPVSFASETQINFQMPFEVQGRSLVRVKVFNGSVESGSFAVQIIPAAPGVFTFQGASGSDRAVAVNADGSLNTAQSSGARMQPLVVYMTGQGPTAPEWRTGRAAGANPLILAPLEAHAYIGGVEAKITFLGLAPGLVGVLQMNVEPAFQTPVGDQPMIVNIGGHESNVATVTIR